MQYSDLWCVPLNLDMVLQFTNLPTGETNNQPTIMIVIHLHGNLSLAQSRIYDYGEPTGFLLRILRSNVGSTNGGFPHQGHSIDKISRASFQSVIGNGSIIDASEIVPKMMEYSIQNPSAIFNEDIGPRDHFQIDNLNNRPEIKISKTYKNLMYSADSDFKEIGIVAVANITPSIRDKLSAYRNNILDVQFIQSAIPEGYNYLINFDNKPHKFPRYIGLSNIINFLKLLGFVNIIIDDKSCAPVEMSEPDLQQNGREATFAKLGKERGGRKRKSRNKMKRKTKRSKKRR